MQSERGLETITTEGHVQKKPDPCSFIIFGATGDLTHRLVVPALYNLAAGNLLPDKFCVVGIVRKGMSSEQLSDSLMQGLRKFATRPVDEAIAKRLFECVTSVEADPRDPASFDAMNERLDKLEKARGTGGNRLFYLATPPSAFLPISEQLGRTGMLEENGAWRRLIIEKPFGTDLASARALNAALLKLMDEHQIYRIDHYLGKETVQNILVLRFANGMFEPIWNRNHIDHIQITVDEKLGVGHRGSFYDATGALRDMVPNHLFQLLSLVALFYVSVAVFVLGVLGAVMALAGINILKFLGYLREELMIVVATASSDAVLPQVMRKLERFGVKDSVVGLVIPTGYSFNLDAFSIYLTLAVVFIAQATNTPLSFGDLLLVLGVSLITSKGAHGVPGSAIVILAATLNAVPSIPAIGLVLVLSVDWFIGMARAVGNLIGNCVATVVVAAWEGDLDRDKARRVLEGTDAVDVTAG